MLKKLQIKIMRTVTMFSVLRFIAIKLKKTRKKPTLKRIHNKDLELDTQKVYSEIETNGFSSILKISNKRLERIIDYAKKTKFREINKDELFSIDYNNPKRPSKNLWYIQDNAIACEAIEELVYDSKILDIAKRYLTKEPTVQDVRMWWSFQDKNTGYNPTYGYHYDIDAYKFLKLFVYLTDVDEESGPHVIISKTHKSKSLFEKMNRRLKEEQVKAKFDNSRINIMTAPKGAGFFEDTFAYHKGTNPKKPRLIMQIEYSI